MIQIDTNRKNIVLTGVAAALVLASGATMYLVFRPQTPAEAQGTTMPGPAGGMTMPGGGGGMTMPAPPGGSTMPGAPGGGFTMPGIGGAPMTFGGSAGGAAAAGAAAAPATAEPPRMVGKVSSRQDPFRLLPWELAPGDQVPAWYALEKMNAWRLRIQPTRSEIPASTDGGPTAQVEQPAPPISGRVAGIMLSNPVVAILQTDSGTRIVKPGDEVNRYYRVSRIDSDKVILTSISGPRIEQVLKLEGVRSTGAMGGRTGGSSTMPGMMGMPGMPGGAPMTMPPGGTRPQAVVERLRAAGMCSNDQRVCVHPLYVIMKPVASRAGQ